MIVALSLTTGCQTKRNHHQDSNFVNQYNVQLLYKQMEIAEKERDEWKERIERVSPKLQEEAERARNSVYSDEEYTRDSKKFVDSMLRRIDAIIAEARYYRSWYYRNEK